MFHKNKKGKEETGKEEAEKKKGKKPKKEKTAKAPKERSDVYIMRRNTGMKIARVVLWCFLGFIFIRGVLSVLHKDSVEQANALIRDFKAEFADYKDDNEEILGFAQNFTKEYLTYEKGEENDYADRLKGYVSANVHSSAADLAGFQGKATAVYAKAYRKEEYAPGQYNVYVTADVEYENEVTTEKAGEEIKEIVVKRRPVTIKVPVYAQKGKYVVEDIPVFVSDSLLLASFKAPEYQGALMADGDTRKIKEAVTSFLTAYYEQEQNVIEYYLTKDADRAKFQGLNGRYTFESLERVSCYELSEGKGILCIVEFMVTDAENGSQLKQALHLTIKQDGDKYYVQDMDTRTGHLYT